MSPFNALRSSVAQVYNVAPGALQRQYVNRRHALPRQALYTAARELLGLDFTVIGRMTNRDHTTVRYGHQRHMERLGEDEAEQRRMRLVIELYSEQMQGAGRWNA